MQPVKYGSPAQFERPIKWYVRVRVLGTELEVLPTLAPFLYSVMVVVEATATM